MSFRPVFASPAASLLAAAVFAQPAPPGSLSVAPADASGSLALVWSAVSGSTGYIVKRADNLGGPYVTLANALPASPPAFVDSTALPGARYHYTVASLDASGPGPAVRGVWASPVVLLDNALAGSGATGVAFTGTWTASGIADSFGNISLFASPVAASSPTATYTFTPTLPARGLYDVYLRWTADAGRAGNVPVDVVFPDGARTFFVNQRLNGGAWNYLTTVAAEAGATTSVILRNNGADGSVIADAVQFVPRLAPWAPAADAPQDYTLLSLVDDFDGASINQALWGTFAGRGAHSVSGGKLHTKQLYVGSVPLAFAATADLEDEDNWTQGGIIADHAQKFGYHEARLRLPQAPARGVDTAYWHAATDEYINGYEMDAPEFFNTDATGANNHFAFGNWDHVLPTVQRINPDTGKLLTLGRTWDYGRKSAATFGDLAQYITVGFEWRTDNTQVVYLNGQKVYTAPASGMNDIESILPAQIILSTKVLDWMRPNAALDGAEATWDYVRHYQKPGFTGTANNDWSQPANWGPDGVPGPGRAAVFNLPGTPAAISLAADHSLQSLFLQGASLPAHVFSGAGKLLLGAAKAGDDSVTHGGVLVNTDVAATQTIQNDLVGLQNLQFANLSRSPGVSLLLNGDIAGDGVAPRDVDFVSSLATNPALGVIVLARPLGAGLRHVNRAGDSVFTLPAGSRHTGELRIARGPVVIPDLSALGLTADSAVEFGPRYAHSESWRPRLTYAGPYAVSEHPIRLSGWAADGVLESSGTGPLTWSGDVSIEPYSHGGAMVLTRAPRLTLGGAYTGGENIFSGRLSDAGVVVSYLNADKSINSGPAALTVQKTGAGTWILSGPVSVSAPLVVGAGKLYVGRGPAAPFSAPSVSVGPNAEFGFGADTAVSFSSPISGSGSFRKRGAGTLTLGGAHTYSGATAVDAGALVLAGSLSGAGTVTTAAGATFAGGGSIAGSLSVSGTLSPDSLSVGSSLLLRAGSALRIGFVANNASALGSVAASVLGITSGARVDVALDDPGSAADLRHVYWRTARSWPLITCDSRSGTLALGAVSADSAGSDVSAYGAFSLQHTATGVNLVWTPVPGFPNVDTPSVALTSPATSPVTLVDTLGALRLTANLGGGTTTTITWSLISGPGAADFAADDAADTVVSFSAAGTYVLRATAANVLGSATTELTVSVAPPTALVLRQGVNNYSHAATFIRGDTATWNSGARDQLLVGRTTANFRALLGFDLSAAPVSATVASAALEIWTDAAGSGSVGTIELRPLLRSFVEGTGNGSTASNGAGTGADWHTHDGANAWTAHGGEVDATVLASMPGFSATESGAQKSFSSSAAFAAAVQNAITGATPLYLALVSPVTESGPNGNFIRLASDDHADVARRPQLALALSYSFAPTADPGPAPDAMVNASAPLAGQITRAVSARWSLVGGPGAATFADTTSPATTVTFSAPGAYILRLSAVGSLAEASRTLAVSVAPPPLTPFEAWRVTHFGPEAASGSGIAADLADPDGDGLANLLEFALGGTPASASSAFLPVVSVDTANALLRLDYTRSVAALSSVTVVPEWTDSLAPSPVWSTADVGIQVLSDNGVLQQIRASVPLRVPGARFLRLRVTSP